MWTTFSQLPSHQSSLYEPLWCETQRRGPDVSRVLRRHRTAPDLTRVADMCALGAVLGLRGVSPVPQPYEVPPPASFPSNDTEEVQSISTSSSFLLWNGEVFGGTLCPPGGASDTAAVAARLRALEEEEVQAAGAGSSHAEQVPGVEGSGALLTPSQTHFVQRVAHVLEHEVEGPYGLLYYAAALGVVVFGRDPLGRRSLLVHATVLRPPGAAAQELELLVSSVGVQHQNFISLESLGASPSSRGGKSTTHVPPPLRQKRPRSPPLPSETVAELEEEEVAEDVSSSCWIEVPVSGLLALSLTAPLQLAEVDGARRPAMDHCGSSSDGLHTHTKTLAAAVLHFYLQPWSRTHHLVHPLLRQPQAELHLSGGATLPAALALPAWCTPELGRRFQALQSRICTAVAGAEANPDKDSASLIHEGLADHAVLQYLLALGTAVHRRVDLSTTGAGSLLLPEKASHKSTTAGYDRDTAAESPAARRRPVGILFSGGIDCTVLAALAHYLLPLDTPIELINVAFGAEPRLAPDRIATFRAVEELLRLPHPEQNEPHPSHPAAAELSQGGHGCVGVREWRLVLVDVPEKRSPRTSPHILNLLTPHASVMDFDIGTALWNAARGEGRMQRLRQHVDASPVSHEATGAPSLGSCKKFEQEEPLRLEQHNKFYRLRPAGTTTTTSPPLARQEEDPFALLRRVLITECRETGLGPEVPVLLSTLGKDYAGVLTPHFRSHGFKKLGAYLDAASRKGVVRFDPSAPKSSKAVFLVAQEDRDAATAAAAVTAELGDWYRTPAMEKDGKTVPAAADCCTGDDGNSYRCEAKVLLLGIGADETLGGYTRHRRFFQREGIRGALKELQRDFARLWQRNLGRDDRIIMDSGREARLPFLDEDVLRTLDGLVAINTSVLQHWRLAEGDALLEQSIAPMLTYALGPGEGDKRVLRRAAQVLGLGSVTRLEKRAIQFGSRIAERKVHGTTRLGHGGTPGKETSLLLQQEESCAIRMRGWLLVLRLTQQKPYCWALSNGFPSFSTFFSLVLIGTHTYDKILSFQFKLVSLRRLQHLGLVYGNGSLSVSCRGLIEHDSDPTRWRSPQNAEVRRHNPGVPLGSTSVKEAEMRQQQEDLMAARSEDLHWKITHVFAVGTTLFLMVLQFLPEYVQPVPFPEYVPYEDPAGAQDSLQEKKNPPKAKQANKSRLTIFTSACGRSRRGGRCMVGYGWRSGNCYALLLPCTLSSCTFYVLSHESIVAFVFLSPLAFSSWMVMTPPKKKKREEQTNCTSQRRRHLDSLRPNYTCYLLSHQPQTSFTPAIMSAGLYPQEMDHEEGEEDLDSEDDMDDFVPEINTNTIQAEEFCGTIVETDRNAVRQTLGDFEVLRLAKRGDASSCFNFAESTHKNLKSFTDNADRNALHYAADSGNMELVQRLLDAGVPRSQDSKGLFPVDIAVVNGFSDELVAKLGGQRKSREELLQQLAPKPPAFTISKPAPPAPSAPKIRRFWGIKADGEGKISDLTDPCDTSCKAAEEVGASEVWDTLRRTYCPTESLDAWALPFSPETLEERRGDLVVVTATEKEGEKVGQLLCWKMGQDRNDSATSSLHVDPNASSSPTQPTTIQSMAWAGTMGVATAKHGRGIAAAMMKRLNSAVRNCLGVRYVAFMVPATPLPPPPAAICLVKVFRRSVRPMIAMSSALAEGLYPDYFETDCALRVDTVLKESVQDGMRDRNKKALEEWSLMQYDKDEQVSQLLAFIKAKTASGFDLAYVPSSERELRVALLHSDTTTCVRRPAGGDISDVVVFRRRHSVHKSKKGDVEAVAAEVIYALLPGFKAGPEKMEHLLLLAEQHIGMNIILLVPGLFGITDSDAVKCQFTECGKLRHLLYLVNTETRDSARPFEVWDVERAPGREKTTLGNLTRLCERHKTLAYVPHRFSEGKIAANNFFNNIYIKQQNNNSKNNIPLHGVHTHITPTTSVVRRHLNEYICTADPVRIITHLQSFWLLRSAGVPLAALAGHRDLCTTALVTTSARLGGLVRGYTHRGHSTLCWCRRFFSETTAPLHPGDGDAEEVELDGLEEDENEGGPGASTTDEEEMNEDASRASALLREVYGPHAKLVLQTARVRRRRDAPAEDGTETTPPPVMYRAASTFKLLGFPVELASVMGPDKAAVVDHCLNLSLRSDIPFIDPRKKPPDTRNVGRGRGGKGGRRHQHQGSNNPFVLTPHEMELKAIIDELRQLCIHFSRRLKFSMKEPVTSATVSLSTSIAPSAEELEAAELQRSRSKWTEGQQAPLFPTGVGGGAAGERTNGKADQQLFRCRVYQKDEWSVVARSMFVLESVGPTPHQALLRCMVQLRERFQQEVNDPVHMLEGVHECMALVAHLGKQIHVETVPEQEEKRQNLNKKGNAASAPSNQTQQDLSCSKGSEDSAEAPSETASADNEGSEGEEEADPPRSLAEPDLSLPPVGLTTYTTTVVVKDRYGNVTETKLRRQRSRQVAYQNISQALMKSEMPLLPSAHRLSDGISHSSAAPLLPRIKWQVALFRHRIAQHIGAHPDDIVTVCVRGVSEQQQQQQQQAEEVEEGEIVEPSASGGSGGGSPHRRGQHRDLLFTAVVTVNGDNVIFQAGGSGRYRLALDAHVCALRHLFDQYPDVCALLNQELRLTETLSLFPSKQLLDEALREHDDFPILTQHKGKWNCFAVLGTLTSSLIGSYFQTTYQSAHNAKYWWAILTINTGDCADELLLQRSAKMKGEAWKRACTGPPGCGPLS
eukprot:gene485-265_t